MKFEIYSANPLLQSFQWRWRLVAESGEIIADSSEGYVSKFDCEYAIGLVKATSPTTPVIEAFG
ncbi:YegP family protein [Lysobacter claricitrinus]|uniref:YegP family protein n=1 Tax=Lysobacter claricitrinus TaxID=3367728 RepID=UPI0037DBDB17